MGSHLSTFSVVAAVTTVFSLTPLTTVAQIIPDNSLGNENSVVIPNQNINGINSDTPNGTLHDRIDGGAVRGSNLFHSFQEFNIREGRGAYFSNPDNIVNILTRVTGGNISEILGTLGVLGNANLFFINPAGIVFGPNARLDVGGSFFATTADGILFENGFEFAASNPQAPPLLTINMPLGLNIRENPGTIVNQAILTTLEDGSSLRDEAGFLDRQGLNVPQNQTLALIGGDVIFDNGVAISPGSRIQLGGLSEPGIIELTNVGANGNTPIIQFPENIQRGNIALINESQINVRADGGGDVNINARNVEISGDSVIRAGIDERLGFLEAEGGDVNINAQENILITGAESSIINRINLGGIGRSGNINITANSLSINGGAFISTSLFGQGNAGNINVKAASVEVSGTSPDGEFSSGFFANVNEAGEGNGGKVEINTGNLLLSEGSQISISTFGDGNAGSVSIFATDSVELANSSILGGIAENAVGEGGNIEISTSSLNAINGQISLSASGNGNAGKINIKAQQIDLSDSIVAGDNSGTDNIGNITIDTGNLVIRNGGDIRLTVNQESTGSTGNITVNASESIEIIGVSPTGITSRIATRTFGNSSAGSVIINTPRLTIRDGGRISVSSVNGSSAGSINIQASVVELIGDGRFSSENGEIIFPSAITVSTTRIRDQTSPNIEFSGSSVGSITLEADQLRILNGADISTFSGDVGSSGSIDIRANTLEISGRGTQEITSFIGEPSTLGSGIFTQAGNGGNTGNISITAQKLIATDGAVIRTSSSGTGFSGSISIQGQEVLFDDQVFISSGTAGAGNGGDITIETEQLRVQNNSRISSGISLPNESEITSLEIPQNRRGGTVFIKASESVFIDGERTSIGAAVGQEGAIGNGGNIIIETARLTVSNQAFLSTGAFGIGDAGLINLQAETIELIGGSFIGAIVFETGVGNGGTIAVDTNQLTVRDQSGILVSSRGEGNPGNINVSASQVRLENEGGLEAESVTGQGGNITINSPDIFVRRQSAISAAGSQSGQTFDGNIDINSNFLVLLENSQIVTSAFDPTGGSNINIRPFGNSELAILQSQNSIINAAGELSIDTTLNFDPPETTQVEVVDPAALIAQDPCKQRGDSQFIITGRGGIAFNPLQDLFSTSILEPSLVEPVTPSVNNSSRRRSQQSKKRDNNTVDSRTIVPARGWVRTENGDVILVSYDPTNTGVIRQPPNPQICQP